MSTGDRWHGRFPCVHLYSLTRCAPLEDVKGSCDDPGFPSGYGPRRSEGVSGATP